MEREWPPEWNADLARVALVVDAIQSADFTARQQLLDMFLGTAWPTERTQRQ